MRTRTSAALAASALILTAGCGSSSSRPSTTDISQALQQKTNVLHALGTSKKAADCVAAVLEKSKLSDAALTALVKNDRKFNGTKADTAAVQGVKAQMTKCVMGG